MKKSLILVGALIAAIGLLYTPRVVAQGDVEYDNVTGTPGWTISDLSNTAVPAGSPIMAELWWAPGFNAAVGSLVGTGATGTATGADWIGGGSFFKGVVTLPSGPGQGAQITLQVRAWDPSTGATWNTATVRGANSVTANYTTPTGINTPDSINGLDSFQLVQVPEPSTFALIGLGTGALLFLRRRK